MSNTPIQESTAQRLSSGSGQTLPSRPLQPMSDPSASKRVCFYKSGDYKFSGHRVVINARTFKTFDALLDALSKKVPLPFGVRTITTPRGTHLVKTLDDLHDGGAYVCSDQKRVKPLNLDEVRRRQVPWNTTRPLSVGRRRRRQGLQSGRRNDANNRPVRVTERVAVRTPKKLVVIRNKDPSVKRTIVLHRRIAPTFDALLDYLSQILQFPVLKLYSTDGRRVDGLAALILCSGVVVAAGNEPFRLGNYSFHRTGQTAQVLYVETVEPSTLQPRAQNNKSFSSGRGSRNFSLSSERYIVNQINKSVNGSMNSHVCQPNGSFEGEVNPHHTSLETCETGRVDAELHSCIVPQDDDIEKSFRVNQDGSMTVEMKVRLTIKEEELLHWTTTLSRSSLRKATVCASISESGNSSPNSNNAVAKDSSSISEDETKEENRSGGAGKAVGFNNEGVYEGRTPAALGKGQTSFKRTPTPGPRYIKKKASVESVKMVTESGVHENTLGHYSYMERTADGESSEGYCVITHKSNSSRPIPKPRKTASAGASNKGSRSSIRSSAEVLQMESNGMEVTETVMHIYESQGCYDNYVANEECSTDGAALHDSPAAPDSKPSTVSGPRSSSNDIDFSWKPPTADSLQRQKEDMLSLSSEPISSTHKRMNDLPSETEPLTATVKKDKTPKNGKDTKIIKTARNHKSSTSSSDKKQTKSISPSKNSSNASVGKKSQSSSESAKKKQKPEKPQSKKSIKDEKTPRKDSALVASTENVKRTPPKRQSTNKVAVKDNGHNINTPSGRPQMKKNMSDILKPKTSLLPVKKTVSKPKSMSDMRTPSPKQTLEINESVSMPSLNPTPSEIHQYVENWLEKVSTHQVPYTEETFASEPESQTTVVFQIGGDSETEEHNGNRTSVNENYSQPGDAVKKSLSCLSVPLCHEAPATSLLPSEQKSRGLCVSMPSVRVDPGLHDNRLRAHKSAEDLGPADDESSSFNILSPKAKIKPVLRQLCSSIQCIRRVSDTNATSNLEKSNSLPDFSTQVAVVFGSSCKAFLSFLSVMTLRDSLTGSAQGDEHHSRSTSEAMLMMESLQKISAIEDEEAQRESLTDLQSRASSQFRERWRDFQIFRERLESEPLSPRVSETEFALDVVSEGGDAFEDQNVRINELMDELNLPEDLRAEISSTIQHARSFYPVEESTVVETEKNHSDSEEEVEQFIEECNEARKLSPGLLSTCIAGDFTEKTQSNGDGETDESNKMQTIYSEQAKIMYESEQAGPDVKDSEVSQTEIAEALTHNEAEDEEEQVVEESEEENGELIEINNAEGEERKKIGIERDKETEEDAVNKDLRQQDEGESGEESVEKVQAETEDEITVDGEKLEEEEVDETEQRISDAGHSNSVEESDDRKFVEETEEEKGEEGRNEVEETEEQAGDVEETDEEREHTEEQEEDERDEEGEDAQVVENGVEAQIEVFGETDEEVAENIEEKKEEAEEVMEDVEGEVEEVAVETEDDEDEEKSAHTEEGSEEDGVEEVVVEEAAAETDENEEEEESINTEEKSEEEGVEDVVGEETDEEEEEEKSINTEEKSEEEGVEEVVGEETDEEEEEEKSINTEGKSEEEGVKEVVGEETDGEEEEEKSINTEEKSEEERVEEVVGEEAAEETDEDEEQEDKVEEVEEKREEEGEVVEWHSAGGVEETDEVTEEKDEKKEYKNKREEVDEEDGREEMDVVIDETDLEDDEPEVGCEENNDKKEEEEYDVDEDEDANVEVENTEMERAKLITEGEEEEGESDGEDESADVEALETRGQMSEQDKDDDEESKAEGEEGAVSEDVDSFPDDTDCKSLLQTISYLHQQGGTLEQNSEPSTKYSSDVQCEDDKGTGMDTVNESDEGGEDLRECRPHPVEISQELLDFVNSALQSSSLTFSYDSRGNIRIEPDNARLVNTEQVIIPKSSSDSLYGVNCLPSPSTSDLSDYRPESSESGGYKTQESVDIVTESGEEASEKPFPIYRRKTDIAERRTTGEPPKPKLSVASKSQVLESSRIKSADTSHDSGSKASREDLSYFSAASSLKAEAEAAPGSTRCMSRTSEKDPADGVLIDQGRWLLKENHLIRKSPPVSLGMYGNLDSTSMDTGQENTSDDSPPHYKTTHNPLAAISSSELEEMAKPLTPKCTYYNMPHGSDSDPFLDDSSVKSGRKDTSSFKGRSSKVTPIDTSKTRVNKNGSLSSFASVEFKIPDKKVHPEGESVAAAQTRRTSSGGGSVLQAQDSLDTLHLRCSQYCPIL